MSMAVVTIFVSFLYLSSISCAPEAIADDIYEDVLVALQEGYTPSPHQYSCREKRIWWYTKKKGLEAKDMKTEWNPEKTVTRIVSNLFE